jgi:hypothetical protein
MSSLGRISRVDSQLSLSEARSMTGLPLPSDSRYEFRIHPAISETDRSVFLPDYQTDYDRARAEEGTQTPSLPRTPSRLRRAPSTSPDRNFSAATSTRSRSLSDARLRMAGVHSSFPSERPSRLSSLSQSNSGPISSVYPPPNTLTSSYYFRHSNKHTAKNKFAGSQFSGRAALPSFCCESCRRARNPSRFPSGSLRSTYD